MRTTSTTRTPLEEKLSLSARFGVRINYSIPNRTQFQEMVRTLAQRQGLTVPAEVLLAEANKWELRHGGVSGRTAQQFINYMGGASAPAFAGSGNQMEKENLLPREKHLFEEGLKARPLLSEKQGEVAL